ncbi:MAG: hypothetical protein EZS28_034919, partial [Streblomastix strix]
MLHVIVLALSIFVTSQENDIFNKSDSLKNVKVLHDDLHKITFEEITPLHTKEVKVPEQSLRSPKTEGVKNIIQNALTGQTSIQLYFPQNEIFEEEENKIAVGNDQTIVFEPLKVAGVEFTEKDKPVLQPRQTFSGDIADQATSAFISLTGTGKLQIKEFLIT